MKDGKEKVPVMVDKDRCYMVFSELGFDPKMTKIEGCEDGIEALVKDAFTYSALNYLKNNEAVRKDIMEPLHAKVKEFYEEDFKNSVEAPRRVFLNISQTAGHLQNVEKTTNGFRLLKDNENAELYIHEGEIYEVSLVCVRDVHGRPYYIDLDIWEKSQREDQIL